VAAVQRLWLRLHESRVAGGKLSLAGCCCGCNAAAGSQSSLGSDPYWRTTLPLPPPSSSLHASCSSPAPTADASHCLLGWAAVDGDWESASCAELQ
jgi:hypothetical protein